MPKVALLLAGLTILPLCACSRQPSLVVNQMDPTQERLLLVGNCYRQFNGENRRPPKSAAELLPILKQRGGNEDSLQSTRDGQPFVICYGLDVTKPPAGSGRPVLAYEKQGSEGSRFVLLTMGNVDLLKDEAFRASSFPPGFKPDE